MAPAYHINTPDVLATLPRPLDQSRNQFHAGEVFTQQLGGKKRKRLEVAVGVDGEAANIYHIPSSALRTSYPIPPQESFTCPPYSIRYQTPKSSTREQYTYFSTHDGTGFKITVCRDVVNAKGKTTSTSKSRELKHPSPVKQIYTSFQPGSDSSADADKSEAKAGYANVLAVCNDGQVMCLDGASLDEKWSLSSYSLCKDSLAPAKASGFHVDSAFHASADEVLKGIFEGRQDVFSAFGRSIDPESFNPDVILIVATIGNGSEATRHLHVFGAITGTPSASSQPSLVQLHSCPLSLPPGSSAPDVAAYQLHTRSGRLLELSNNVMRTFDLTAAVPRIRDSVIMPDGSSSFVQLSEHSVLSISPASLTVTNVTYRSVQAQTAVPGNDAAKSSQRPMLLTYLSKLDLAIAVMDNTLFSIQIQRQQKSLSKEGLLIDAIGKGLSKADYLPDNVSPCNQAPFSKLLPGTLSDAYVRQSLVEVEKLDNTLVEGNLAEFEKLLAAKFEVNLDRNSHKANGAEAESVTPDWVWLEAAHKYPTVDRRWVLYAVSRMFSLGSGDGEKAKPTLQCTIPESNVLTYLVVAGHLTLSNIVAAFRNELNDMGMSKEALAGELIQQLSEIDPTLELLLNYVLATKTSQTELLLVTRSIMQSLDQQSRLVRAAPQTTTQEDEYMEMEIDKMERELELAEYHLGDDSNVQARLLTTAFERLAGYAPVAIVQGLRNTFTPTEILSLIHLLRVQLVGSAWTTKYSEITALDQDEATKSMPDTAIALISELLARCIDAIGTHGWLTNLTVGDQADGSHFLTALKLEVNAALEGLNEAIALNGLLGETVRFGSASLSNSGGRALIRSNSSGVATERPRAIELGASSELPLGLAPKQGVSQYKVVSGGEVVERSAREKGHLISQKVKAYSLERISV